MNNRSLLWLKPLFGIALVFFLTACTRVEDKLEPKINYSVQDKYLKQLPSPFPQLTLEERQEAWGKEYLIGLSFARELDLYQAITAFKRAKILIPSQLNDRKLEIEYEILLCYYLGKKYTDVAYAFEQSPLRNIDQGFPACHDLLVILYDTYLQLNEPGKAEEVLTLIKRYYPETAEKLTLSTALTRANLPKIETFTPEYPFLQEFLTSYEQEKKSIAKAQTLNAFLPGAGYLYLGQRQSALTAFLLNGLFIAASYHFFHRGHLAAGIIFSSFEAGWYFGGIYGAGEEAKFYNERLYETKATPFMNQKGLFPVFMLNYAF
jgi:hypothetical protein